MADVGIVAYDSDDGVIDTTSQTDDLTVYLEIVPGGVSLARVLPLRRRDQPGTRRDAMGRHPALHRDPAARAGDGRRRRSDWLRRLPEPAPGAR